MQSNITRVAFGTRNAITAPPLWQYDYGQMLVFTDLTLPDTYETHFAQEGAATSYTVLGDENGVAIPDILLQSAVPFNAYLYLHAGANDGETEKVVHFPVNARSRPDNGTPTPVQQDVITEAIAALNDGVERAEDAVEHYPKIENGYWYVWDVENGEWVNTNIHAQGPQGETGPAGADGHDGAPGQDGRDGQDGQDGTDGTDGVSPTVTVTDITGGHRITITDVDGAHSFDVLDGSTPSVPVTDVQVNGTSVLSNGVANVPIMGGNTFGVAKLGVTDGSYGLSTTIPGYTGQLLIEPANDSHIKAGSGTRRPLSSAKAYVAAFYGLAKAAGADMRDIANTTVGTYPETQKSAISQMFSAPETVSGSTPNITAKPGIRYICGEVSTLDITTPSSGIIDVVFESGSTATVLTVTPPTGMTMKWANGFDPTALEANTTYEINIEDGKLGVAMAWT